MPKNYKIKSNNNSRNSSLKSTASSDGTSVSVSVCVDDDGFAGLLAKVIPQRKVSKQKESNSPARTPSPGLSDVSSVEEAAPKPTPWEEFNITEGEFNDMLNRVAQRTNEAMKQEYEEYLHEEWDSTSFWNRRIENLERERETFNKKRSWSALDQEIVEQLDYDIKECERNLDRIFDEIDRLEYEYD